MSADLGDEVRKGIALLMADGLSRLEATKTMVVAARRYEASDSNRSPLEFAHHLIELRAVVRAG